MISFFLHIYRYFKSHKGVLFLSLIMSFSVCFFLLLRIDIEEDISKFLPKNEDFKDVEFVLSQMSVQDEMIVQLALNPSLGWEEEAAKGYCIDACQYFVSYLDSLDVDPRLSIDFQTDEEGIFLLTHFIHQNIPYFMDSSSYSSLEAKVKKEAIESQMLSHKNLLGLQMGSFFDQQIAEDPLNLSRPALLHLLKLSEKNDYALYDGYYFSKTSPTLILLLKSPFSSTQTAENADIIKDIRLALEKTEGHFPAISTHFFGSADIAVSNASQIKKDSFWAIGLSIVLICVLLWFYFKNIKAIFLLVLPVCFGAIFSLAMIQLWQGQISSIALGAGSIIFGISISYSIHFISHYLHVDSKEQVIKEVTSPMIIGSLSTVGAFFSILFIHSEAMRDFGVFAALTLIGSILFTLVFLPHFVSKKETSHRLTFEKITHYRFEKNRILMGSIVALTIVWGFFAGQTQFETNMQSINFMSDVQREDMKMILSPDTASQVLCLASLGKTLDEATAHFATAKAKMDALEQGNKILQNSHAFEFIVSEETQKKRLDAWQQFWTKDKSTQVIETIKSAGQKSGFTEFAFEPFFHTLQDSFVVQNISYFNVLPFLSKFYIETSDQSAVLAYLKVPNEYIEEVMSSLLSKDIVIFNPMSFQQTRAKELVEDFNWVLFICGFIVFVFLWFSFGRLEITIIAFLPMVLSWIWILGIMGLFGISFNIVNVILAAFIFGLGDDFSIFMTDGLLHENAYHSQMTNTHKGAVILSALTMLLGIGTLIFAKHPAMLSLAYVTIIGMGTVVVLTYVVPPFLFSVFTKKRGQKRLIPITFYNLGISIYSFTLFLLGTIILTIAGFVLLTLLPKTEKNKLRFHQLLRFILKISIRNLPSVKTKIQNYPQENFDTPAVIIANHQSHLDLACLLMLSPKLILLTNKWVWNSPFYGIIIRYADFFPVANGIENGIDILRERVKNGYSIVVFPEGTRSKDGQISRFHKGAFYLAEQLKIAVLPIVLHGIGQALPKQEFLLRKSVFTIHILKRIPYSEDYLSLSKACRKIIRDAYSQLVIENETPEYFSDFVLKQYIYKGYAIEKQAKKSLRWILANKEQIDKLPSTGIVLVKNCNIGVFTLLSALIKKELTLIAYDENPEYIRLAQQASRCSNLSYTSEYPHDIDFDVIIDLNERA